MRDINIDKSKIEKVKNQNKNKNYPRLMTLSFLGVIIIGTVLLMLPISIKQGKVGIVDALLTATSATCVTGLISFDTFTKWTLFGQVVILCLIQIGGLGFITITTMLSRFLKKKLSVRGKIMLRESLGSIYAGEYKALTRRVLLGTALFEILGAVILSTQFVPMMGNWKNGVYTAVFLSVSAFCNAGFDVMGRIEAGSSLMTVNDNPVIILTISMLIIIGGIGFIVWDDIVNNKFRAKKYSMHTKLTLTTSAILLLLGTIVFFIFEYNNTMKDMNIFEKLLNAFFTSTTTRTAGFNSISTAGMTDISKFFTYGLMLIGGSSASTAGGIKTSTIAVLVLCVIATLKNSNEVNAFGKKINDQLVRKATAILLINTSVILISSIVLQIFMPNIKYIDLLFECFSAMGTVGMTADVTSQLTTIPKLLITLLMFIGRMSSLTFVFSFRFNDANKSVQKPAGYMLVG